jgi:Lrp/AsnC family leucine-responsive transcriptional regulator
MHLDATDLALLAALQAESRLSNVELAARVGLSPSPCLRRLRRLESEGVIEAYRAVLDRAAVGLGLTAFVELKVERAARERPEEVAAMLTAIPGVVACHMISGSADFLIEIVATDLAAYERLLSERLLPLPMVADLRTSFSLRRFAAEGALPLPQPEARPPEK